MNDIRMRFPGGLKKAFTMSYDDGVEQDVRLISIMRKNGVKGTFNLNGGLFAPEGTVYPKGQVHRRMTLSACKKAYAGEDLEVAVHGYTHPFLETLPAGPLTAQILKDRESLEEAFGTLVRGAAYPYGTYNDRVAAALDLCGIVYCRTVASTHDFRLPQNWLTLHPTCHHADPALTELCEKFLASPADREPLMFYLWGHAYEFEGADNWEGIESFLSRIGGHDDIWYATNLQIHDYVKAFEALIYSCDGRRVYNPTAADLWLETERMTVKIPAGAEIRL